MYTQFRKVTWWLVAYKCVGSRIYEVLCSAVQVTTPPKLNEATHYQLSSVTFDAATIKIIAVDNIIIFIFILWSKTRGRLSPKSTCFLALPGKKEVNSSNLLEVLKCKLNLYLIVLQCNQFVTSHRNMLIHFSVLPRQRNCSTWQSILHHVTKLLVMWSDFIMLSNEKLLHICNLDIFTFKIAPQIYNICLLKFVGAGEVWRTSAGRRLVGEQVLNRRLDNGAAVLIICPPYPSQPRSAWFDSN